MLVESISGGPWVHQLEIIEGFLKKILSDPFNFPDMYFLAVQWLHAIDKVGVEVYLYPVEIVVLS